MFLLRRPTSLLIDRFIEQAHDLELSYQPVGITRTSAPPIHEYVVAIGQGVAEFDRARRALRDWRQFELGWVELHPRDSPIAVGTNVAVVIKHLGFWSLNGCRVVYQLEEPSTRFGCAYGTLPTHAESGEELFEVSFDERTGEVLYRIRVMAGLQSLVARLGTPYVKTLQARFRRDSASAMRRAINSLAS